MDPELMQLFLAAKGKNKNVSGLLGNMDNQMLAYLSGALNPETQVSGASGGADVWNTYYGNEAYPELQPILNAVAQGADKYQVQAALDAAVGSGERLGPFSVDTARSLVSQAQEEFSGGGKGGKQDMWSKAGLSSPLDIYTEDTVPLNEDVARMILGIRERGKPLRRAAAKAASMVRILQSQKRRGKEDRDIENEVLAAKPSELIAGGYLADVGSGKQPYVEGALEMGKGPKKRPKKDVVSEEDILRSAQRQAGIMEGMVNRQTELERAARRGVLRAYQEAGRTPLRDELATMMRFVSGK